MMATVRNPSVKKKIHVDEEDDPFSTLRAAAPLQLLNPTAGTSADELKTEFQQYMEKQFPRPDSLCVFRKNYVLDFPIMASLAKKVLKADVRRPIKIGQFYWPTVLPNKICPCDMKNCRIFYRATFVGRIGA